MHTLPLKVGRQSRQICRVRGTGPLTMMEIKTTDVDVKEYIKIFGRLGEKMIFGDASAGLCCHSACENCEWRYSFDVLQSARPKWIPTYRVNKFEVPPSTFFACASLDKALTARRSVVPTLIRSHIAGRTRTHCQVERHVCRGRRRYK